MSTAKRPNILFAIADDASHMGAYGHEWVDTPAFDRVAREGILFENCFATNPKCAPSRASIVTGMHTWQLEEACDHFGLFPSKFAVFPDLLEDAGYHVGYTGKGWGPGDWKRLGRTRNPVGPEYSTEFLTPPEETRVSNKDYAANFEKFIEQREEGQPFYFWYGGHEPHRHYVPGEGIRAGKDPATVKVPPYWPDTDEVRSDMCDYAFEIEWFDSHLGRMLEKLEEIGELDNTLVVVTSDNGAPFPRVKGNMYEDDFHLPMAVCWKNRIEPGRTVADLVSFIDIAPTFLEAAGLHVHRQMAGKSWLNLFEQAGSGVVDSSRDRIFMGRERHDMGRLDDRGYPVRCLRTPQYLYVRNFAPELWPAGNPETGFTGCDSSPTKELIIGMREKGDDGYFNLCFGKRPPEELYDITEDAACMQNLADDPAFADLKAELWAELEAELRRTGDPRIFGQGEVFDNYEYVGNATHSWKNYKTGTWQRQGY